MARGLIARIAQRPHATVIQIIPAAEIISKALWLLTHFHKTKANPTRPMQPREAPCESRLAAIRPRFRPSKPTLALRFISWLSTKLALAGKIAGKARKRPPTPGPKCFAIKAAATVDSPPNKNRTAYSCGLVCLREDQLTAILLISLPGEETTSQTIRQTMLA